MCVAILATCSVAYAVFHQCRLKKETFVTVQPSSDTHYISGIDILPGQLSTGTCKSADTPYALADAQVSLRQSLGSPIPIQKTSINVKRPCDLDEKNKAIVPVTYGTSGSTDLNMVPLYGFKCAWAKNHSSFPRKTKTATVKLTITLRFYYTLNGTDFPQLKRYPVQLDITNKWNTFIPIPATVIQPKIANIITVYSVSIARTDTNHETILGVESISLVKYYPDTNTGGAQAGGWQDFIATNNGAALNTTILKVQSQLASKGGVYQDTQKGIKGTRTESGIFQFEPMALLSQRSYTTTNTPRSSSSAGTRTTQTKATNTPGSNPTIPYQLPHQNTLVATINQNPTGAVTHQTTNSKSFTIRAYFTNVPASGVMRVCVANINPSDTQSVEYLRAAILSDGRMDSVVNNATTVATHISNNGLDGLLNILDGMDTITPDNRGTVPMQHIGMITLTNLQPNVLCEFAVILAEQLDTNTSYVLMTESVCAIQLMQYVPVHSTNPSVQPVTLLRDTHVSELTVVPLDAGAALHDHIQQSVFVHNIIDPDASIIRFERHPTIASTPMTVCAASGMAMNDGFAFYGSLLVPLSPQELKNNNQILSLRITLESKNTLVFNITRDSVQLLMNALPIKHIPLNNQANDYSWYIYIYHDTFCINVNNTFFQGRHSILQEMYEHDAARISLVSHAYDAITNVRLQIEPTIEIRSRFISAIRYAPTKDIMNLRREDQLLLDAKAVAMYTQPTTLRAQVSAATPPELVTASVDEVISYYSGVSVQLELVPIHLRMDMYVKQTSSTSVFAGEVHLFENEAILLALQKRPTKRPSPHFFYLVVYFKCANAYKAPVILAEETTFLREYGANPKIILKYSCYKNMERVCIFNYDTRPKLVISKTHIIKKQHMKRFRKVSYHPTLVTNLIVSHRTMSTNCNPYNTSTDCDCSGVSDSDPNHNTTNFACLADESECERLENSKLSASTQVLDGLTDTDCKLSAYNQYGSRMLSSYSNSTGKCSISEYPTNIVADTQTDSSVYTCRNKCDQGMRILNVIDI